MAAPVEFQKRIEGAVQKAFRGTTSSKTSRRRNWRGFPAPETFMFRCGCLDCSLRRGKVDKPVPDART
jgi:hypothetical protein